MATPFFEVHYTDVLRFCVLGCGKMGEAIVSGILNARFNLRPDRIYVVEHSESQRERLAEEYGVKTFPTLKDARVEFESLSSDWSGDEGYSKERSMADRFDFFLIAVKPQAVPQLLEEMRPNFKYAKKPPLIVSIAAGITTDTIASAFDGNVRVVRVMPNTPLKVGQGASVVAAGPGATENDVDLVREQFAYMGTAEVVDESQIDAVCALSGGGPAYTALMIEALTKAGAAQGLSPELAQKLAVQTILGTCQLINDTSISPEAAREAVCSPGGTTLAALAAMESPGEGFSASIEAGIAAAVARAKELAKC